MIEDHLFPSFKHRSVSPDRIRYRERQTGRKIEIELYDMIESHLFPSSIRRSVSPDRIRYR